jgi:hypothetical protein
VPGVLARRVRRNCKRNSAELADLHVERRGLELALARLAGTAEYGGSIAQLQQITSEPESIPLEEEWRMLGKTDAVKRVLAEATKPLSPSEIVVTLKSVGLPQGDSESVRGALAYLKRKGKANFISRSQWILIDGAVHRRLQREEPAQRDGYQLLDAGQADLTYVEVAPMAPVRRVFAILIRFRRRTIAITVT